jgi:type I restriction enzyme, S subunit
MSESPRGWDELRLKTCVSNVVEPIGAGETAGATLALENVEGWTGVIRGFSEVEGAVKQFRRGDVLFGKLRPYLAKVALPDTDGTCVGEFLVLRPKRNRVDSKFIAYLLRSKPIIEIVTAATSGAKMPRAEWDFIGSIRAMIPPAAEQELIVRFLDHADRRIRRAIRAKHELVALLNEQKQAVIYRAVTRGLDPNVRLKPSGVDWIGDLPQHWEVRRLGLLLRERGETNADGAVTQVLSLLRARGVIPYEEKGNVGNKKSEDITRYKVVRPNDVVVNCMNVIIGSVGLSRLSGCLSPVYYVLETRSDLDDPRYLNGIFQCRPFQRNLTRIGKGILAHRMRIPMELLKSELLPRPPAEEQKRIVNVIDETQRVTEVAVAQAEREIALFREYRTRLIADVVTGKLDVREAAARLPDEIADEPEPLDETGVDETAEEDVEDLEPVEA